MVSGVHKMEDLARLSMYGIYMELLLSMSAGYQEQSKLSIVDSAHFSSLFICITLPWLV